MFYGKSDGEMPCVASELEKKHDAETYLSPEEQARIEEEKKDMKVELAVNWLSEKQGRTWEALGPDGVNASYYEENIENHILGKIKILQDVTKEKERTEIYAGIGKFLVEQAIDYAAGNNETIVWKLPK